MGIRSRPKNRSATRPLPGPPGAELTARGSTQGRSELELIEWLMSPHHLPQKQATCRRHRHPERVLGCHRLVRRGVVTARGRVTQVVDVSRSARCLTSGQQAVASGGWGCPGQDEAATRVGTSRRPPPRDPPQRTSARADTSEISSSRRCARTTEPVGDRLALTSASTVRLDVSGGP